MSFLTTSFFNHRYHGPGDSPFLQWVPGAGGPPQTVNRRAEEGNLFRNRIKVIWFDAHM